jgi:hypothetical protein
LDGYSRRAPEPNLDVSRTERVRVTQEEPMRTTTTLAASATAVIVGALLLTGCGTPAASSGTGAGSAPLPSLPASPVADQPSPTPSTTTSPTTSPNPSPTPTTAPTPTGPLFATPEAAMAAMAKAFNTGDTVALKRVTTPPSRQELYDMWPNPVHLRLSRCQQDSGSHAYVCFFPHDPPKGMDPHAVPEATMLVEPAARPGWYMSELMECG